MRSLWTLSCLVGLLTAIPVAARGSVDANQLEARFTFSNVDPTIRAFVDTAPAWGMNAFVLARSTGVSPALEHITAFEPRRPEGARGQLSVQAGTPGIAYDVQGVLFVSPPLVLYTNCVPAAPIGSEPAPDVPVTFSSCLGLVRFQFLDENGLPLPTSGGDIEAVGTPTSCSQPNNPFASVPIGSTSFDFFVLAPSDYDITVRLFSGSTPLLNLTRHEHAMRLTVACDQVLVVPIVVPADGGVPLGSWASMSGIADVLGVHEYPEWDNGAWPDWQRTAVHAVEGPWGNDRYDVIRWSPASGAFDLPNLVPSDVTTPPTPYRVRAAFALGRDSRRQDLTLEESVILPAGGNLDLGDAFIVNPGRARGDIVLRGPLSSSLPVPVLSTIALPDTSGMPLTQLALSESSYAEALIGPATVPIGLRDVGGHPAASGVFPGSFDATTGAFSGDYDLVVGGTHQGSATCALGRLELLLRHEDILTGDPRAFVESAVGISDEDAVGIVVDPGAVVEHDISACFSEVVVSFESTSAPFYDPVLETPQPAPTWQGTDFQGRAVRRAVALGARGTPVEAWNAGTSGLVVTTLPEGVHELHPEVTTVNPGGGTSTTRLWPFTLQVGCGETIVVHSGLVLNADPLPPCTEAGLVTINGSVTGGTSIARVTCEVNGGPPIVACMPCGVDPTFSIPVPIPDGDVTLTITAQAVDGRTASRSSSSIGAREPSALDLRPAAPPLRLSKSANDGLDLRWEPDGPRAAHVYRGTIASLSGSHAYDHAAIGGCDIVGGAWLAPSQPAGSYYLVGAACPSGAPSLGRDSSGAERPQASPRCP